MSQAPLQISRSRLGLLFVLPLLGVLVLAAWPLILGTGTLVHRDVFTTHLRLTEAFAAGLEQGRIPLLDPFRAGGQALVGNPNAVALYPTRLLHAVASPLRVLNAHFWIHWLLAPLAGWWMGRAWGLGRLGAWTVGVAWATGGFFLSQLNLMNLVAGASLAPALIASFLRLVAAAPVSTTSRVVRSAAPGLLWALLLLGGDPIFAVLALLAALAASIPVLRRAPQRSAPLLLALVAGTLLAAPMLLELLRILPGSFRGHWELSARAVLAQSWDPRTLAELFLPLVFGDPGLGFWGFRFYGGNPPLFYSLAPGPPILALILVGLASGARRRARLWAAAMIGLGLFLALGAWNPLIRLALDLPGADLLRYPVKAWLLVALGTSLLAGLGMERTLRVGPGLARGVLGVLALLYGLLWWTALRFGPSIVAWIAETDGRRFLPGVLESLPSRWAAICLTCLLLTAAALGSLVLVRRRPVGAAALLLALQAVGQVFMLLGALVEIDATAPYLEPSPLLASVPPESLIAHGGSKGLFGAAAFDAERLGELPDLRSTWLSRLHAAQLYPFAGTAAGRRYVLDPSTEGLDTFYVVALNQAMPRLADDAHRLRILRAAGVDRLILDRPLDDSVPPRPPLSVLPGPFAETAVHALDAPPPIRLATTIRPAPHLDAAVAMLVDPAFDSARDVVVAGEGQPEVRPPGVAEVLARSPTGIDIEVRSPAGGILVTDRAFLALWTARLDARPTETVVANAHLLGVPVPPGVHRLRLEIDRRPFRLGVVLAAVGLLMLAGTALRGTGSPERR